MATELGTAYVQIVPSADGIQGKLEQTMSPGAEKAGATIGQKMGGGIGNALKTTGAVLAGLGSAAVGAGKAIWDSANATATLGDTIDKQSQKMGVSAEQYQALSFAAEHSGISISKFQTAAAKVEKAGFNGTIYDYVDALMAIEDPAERAAEANAVLGEKLANELQPLINGSTTMSEYTAQLSELGGMMSNQAVADSAAFEDSLTNLNTAMDGFKNSLMSQVLPGITTFMDGMSMMVSGQEGASEKMTEGAQQIIGELTAMIPQLIEFVKSIALAILEAAPMIIESLANGIITALPTIVPVLLQVVQNILMSLIGMLPQIIEAGVQIITSLVSGIAQAIPIIIPAIIDAVIQMIQAIVDNIPLLIQAAIQFFGAIVEAIPDAIIQIVAALPQIITSIVDALGDAIPLIIEAAFNMLIGLVKAIPQVIVSLVNALPDIITSIISFLTDPTSLFTIIEGAVTLLMAIVEAIPQIVVALVSAMPKIIMAIVDGLKPGISAIADWGKEMLPKAKEAIADVLKGIKEKFDGFKNTIMNVGKNMIQGLWNGINNAKDWILSKIKGFMSAVTDGIKNFFGIHSPSTLFRDEIGINLAYGIGEGFDDGMDEINRDIDASLQHTYAVAPTSVQNYDYNNNGIGTQLDSSLSSAIARIEQLANPTVEVIVKSDSETLYRQTLKGKRAYEGRYNVAVAY